MDETEIVAALANGDTLDRILVDVGAHHGAVTELFVNKGWSVVAYEPDPVNRHEFQRRIGVNSRVQLSSAAVSDQGSSSRSLYTSPLSSGISTLAAFHESHEPTAVVDVVCLSEDLPSRGISQVDFLKVDIEGFDFFALKGFDWSYAPRFVLYEFEDRKTQPLGYTLRDSSAFMAGHGYSLLYSVWEPIVEYGSRHRWRGLFREPPSDIAQCWGNVLCFRDESDAAICVQRFGHR
ncbi:FkbM family methyltransferase [Mycolicibacterium parafortuitum]|uniref:FkbM family methyltransferase n=1 Tax=Mycolicibacterium parafortuitum TaxID=39692 RepID=UPI0013D5875F|nr:FkbM family methyltransferase [Mycolicibacterium parafortuitum]